VQGDRAALQIVRAIELIERYPELDVLIVGRGGGSGEDLMAFNDERVVRRIAACRVPVVSAVGHEIDVTLTDLAADVRAATPSQAAELVIPDARARRETMRRLTQAMLRAGRAQLSAGRAEVDRLRSALGDPRLLVAERQQQLDELGMRMERQTARALSRRRASLELVHRRLLSYHPRAVLSGARAELAPLRARLRASMQARLGSGRERLGERMARLDALSPLSVLGRGYSIVLAPDGRAVRSAAEVRRGDAVRIRLHRGRLAATITDSDEESG
jgi:exodeoxyribonuclease VII large subunit